MANKASAAAAAISAVSLCISAVSLGYAAKLKADMDDSSKSESSSVAATEQSSAVESAAEESSADDPGEAAEDDSIDQYVMYIGTNDKDTYKPEHTQEEALQIVDEICLKYFDGYTLQEATGSWTDETGTPTHEYTLVCYFDAADEKTVYKAADEIIKELNQNTVLIEKAEIEMDYYSGDK